MMVLRSEPAVEANEVRLAQQLLQRGQRNAQGAGLGLGRVGVRRVRQDAHRERRDQADQFPAAVAQADHAQRPPLELAAHHRRLELPAPLARDALLLGQALGQRQHEQQRRGGRGVVQREGSIEERHRVLGVGRHVDLVVAGPRPADRDEVGGPVSEQAALHRRAQDHQSVHADEVPRLDLQGVETPPVARVARPRRLLGQVMALDEGPAAKEGEVVAVRGPARFVEKVAGEGHVESSHVVGPPENRGGPAPATLWQSPQRRRLSR